MSGAAVALLPLAQLGGEADGLVAVEVHAPAGDEVQLVAKAAQGLALLAGAARGHCVAQGHEPLAVDARDGGVAVDERGQEKETDLPAPAEPAYRQPPPVGRRASSRARAGRPRTMATVESGGRRLRV